MWVFLVFVFFSKRAHNEHLEEGDSLCTSADKVQTAGTEMLTSVASSCVSIPTLSDLCLNPKGTWSAADHVLWNGHAKPIEKTFYAYKTGLNPWICTDVKECSIFQCFACLLSSQSHYRTATNLESKPDSQLLPHLAISESPRSKENGIPISTSYRSSWGGHPHPCLQ